MYSVLLVDDDLQLLKLIRDVFEIEGWTVTPCDCSESAKRAINNGSYDCCIVDLNLPDGDGNRLIERLHTDLNIPIIAISGLDHSLDLAATSQIGADYHLTKPFEPDELVIECSRLIEKHSKQAAIN